MASSPPPTYPRAERMHLTAASRSVKKEKIQGLASPSIVTAMAPNGYTPGFIDASRIWRMGTANFEGPGGSTTPLLEPE